MAEKKSYKGMGRGSNPASKIGSAKTRVTAPAWKKGQSGNPNGGSKLATAKKEMREKLGEIGSKPIEVIDEIMKDTKVPTMYRLTAARDLADRIGGKANQTLDVVAVTEVKENDPDATVEEKAEFYHQRIREGKQE